MSFLILKPGNNEKQRTLIILGAARSMTSLLAGMMHCGGLYFGRHIEPIYEDVKLSLSMESESNEAFEAGLAVRNNDDLWGWKRPSIINHFDRVVPKLRNPHIIVVMRDVASIAMRNLEELPDRQSADHILGKMRANLRIQQMCLAKPREHQLPLCIVSAEKMAKNPRKTAEDCASFFGIELDMTRVESFINKGNERYNSRART